MKIVGNKNAIRTSEFNKKKERERRIKASAGILLIGIILVTPVFLLRDKHLLITSVELSGNNVTRGEELQKMIADDLAGNYFFVIPRSNLFFYPKDKIKNDLLLSIPRLKDVQLELQGAHLLKVSFIERAPSALYCADVSGTPDECYFLDSTGYIFSEAPDFSGGVYHIYSSDPVFDPALRQTFLDEGTLKALDPFLKDLPNIGVDAKALVLRNEEYHLLLRMGGEIIWKQSENLDSVHSNLESFLIDPDFKKDPTSLDRILYIDLRFGNKIFYKFKDGV